MHSLKLSTKAVKSMYKFLKNLSISSLEKSGLSNVEQECFWEAYGAFACEYDEIELGECCDKEQEQADA